MSEMLPNICVSIYVSSSAPMCLAATYWCNACVVPLAHNSALFVQPHLHLSLQDEKVMAHLLVVMEGYRYRHSRGNTRAPNYGEGVAGLLHGHKLSGCSGRRGHVEILATIGLDDVRLSIVGLTGGRRR